MCLFLPSQSLLGSMDHCLIPPPLSHPHPELQDELGRSAGHRAGERLGGERLQDVPLMEEFVNLIDRDHGHLTKQFNKSPATFQMDPKALGKVQGLPDRARDMLSRQAPVSDPRDLLTNFAREGLGLQGEEDVSLAFSRAFKDSEPI